MAEAISFRRGTAEENDVFVGVEGEIVVDLGSDSSLLKNQNENSLVMSGTNKAPTLRFHLGNNSPSGVRVARADMANVNTKALAERVSGNESAWHTGDNLMYANMKNIEYLDDGGATSANVQDVLDQYGIAWKDTRNINTFDLTDPNKHSDTFGTGYNRPLAYADMSNVNTEDLASGEGQEGQHSGKDLAYKDTSNINTADLVSSEKHDGTDGNKPLAYADTTNINTARLTDPSIHTGELNNKPLAYADMSNITSQTLKNKVDKMFDDGYMFDGYELVENKTNNIRPNVLNQTKYVTNKALYDYVDYKLTNIQHATNTLNNITNDGWEIAAGEKEAQIYKLTTVMNLPGVGYTVGETITTNVKILTEDPSETNIIITVLSVDDGRIVDFKTDHDNIAFESKYLQTNVEYTDPNKGAKFTFTRAKVECGGLMKNDLSNSQEINNDVYSAKISYFQADSTIPNPENPEETETFTRIIPTMESSFIETGDKAIINCTGAIGNGGRRIDINNGQHTDWTPIAQLATRNEEEINYASVMVTKEDVYIIKRNWDFNRDNIVATIGYCDEKQNTQNIKIVDNNTITFEPQTAIYSRTIDADVTLTIDASNITLQNNTAKTFEVYITVGETLPTISWAGIDAWMEDSEQTPLSENKTAIFAIRVQKLNDVTKVIANYGGEF